MADLELLIEEATLSDAEAFLECLQAIMNETEFITWDDTVIHNLEEAQEFILKQETIIDSICLLAKVGHQVIGMINVIGQDGIGDLFIALRKDYWGYGIGNMLMEVVDDWAKHTPEITQLSLSVQERNQRAIALYEKNGFQLTSVEADGVTTKNGEVLNLCHMIKELV